MNSQPQFQKVDRIASSHRIFAIFLTLAVALLSLGCGNSIYVVRVAEAKEAFAEAKEMGAEQHAPYLYYSAEVRLKEANRQAAQAEYGNGVQLSREARGYSLQAIALTKKLRAAAKSATRKSAAKKSTPPAASSTTSQQEAPREDPSPPAASPSAESASDSTSELSGGAP